MRVAVIGAGIVGVTTAWELLADGHEVDVYERRSSIAAESSFANAGVVAPGYVTPWAGPGMPSKVLRYLWSRHAPVRVHPTLAPATVGWLWRWWRACEPQHYLRHRGHLLKLATASRDRLRAVAQQLQLDYERQPGFLVLLREPRDVALARPGLKLLAEIGVAFRVVDANRCRELEPGLNPETPLHAGVYLKDDEIGNCRQFAIGLRAAAQQRGARFHLATAVAGIQPADRPSLALEPVDHGDTPSSRVSDGDVPSRTPREARQPSTQSFDAVVVCAGNDAVNLMRRLKLNIPMIPVYGYSVTAPLRQFEAYPEASPRAGMMDERYKVAISRIGSRIRVAGSAEIGSSPDRFDERAMETLYRVLHDWFPGMALMDQATRWKGARPMLADRPPIIGASGRPGVWLNLGHGSSGWALSCGSARLIADAVAGRAAAASLEPFALAS